MLNKKNNGIIKLTTLQFFTLKVITDTKLKFLKQMIILLLKLKINIENIIMIKTQALIFLNLI